MPDAKPAATAAGKPGKKPTATDKPAGDKPKKLAGQPCKRGQSAERTGCIPARDRKGNVKPDASADAKKPADDASKPDASADKPVDTQTPTETETQTPAPDAAAAPQAAQEQQPEQPEPTMPPASVASGEPVDADLQRAAQEATQTPPEQSQTPVPEIASAQQNPDESAQWSEGVPATVPEEQSGEGAEQEKPAETVEATDAGAETEGTPEQPEVSPDEVKPDQQQPETKASRSIADNMPQSKPDHPVAKKIREDAESVAVIDSFLSANKELTSIREKEKQADHEKRVLSKAYDEVVEKYGRDSALFKKIRDKWLDKLHEHTELLKQKEAGEQAARSSLMNHMKPEKPPELAMKEHQGNSWFRNFLLGAATGQSLGAALPGIGQLIGSVAGGVVGGAVTAWLGKVKPTKFSDEDKQGIQRGIDFVKGICEWSGNNKGAQVVVGESADGRAYFADTGASGSKGPTVMMGIDYSKDRNEHSSTMAHELGHMIETYKPGVKEKVAEFLKYRTEGHKEVDMASIPGGEEMKGEKGIPDDFGRHFDPVAAAYVGKSYKKFLSKKLAGTEIVSMGVQALYDDPVGFMQDDPEYATFIIGILRSK